MGETSRETGMLRWRRVAGLWLGPASSAVVLVLLLAWSWGKWPDFLIDFGRELYVPWQLTAGKTLYADIAYFNGPLSPTWNSVLFRLFGTSLRTLALGNALILALVAMMVHHLLRQLTDPWVAAIGTWALLLFFGFAQFTPQTNYTFIAPYSHEMTHGTALATAALVLLGAHLRGRGPWTVFALGLAVGTTFLTKAEFFIAIVPAVLVGLAAHHRAAGTSREEILGLAVRFGGGAILPPLAAYLALLVRLPPDTALRGVAGSWMYLFSGEVREMRFYREITGTLNVGQSMVRIATWTLRYASVMAPAALAAFLVRRSWRASPLAVALLAPAAAATVLAVRRGIDWENLANPFPLVTAVAMVVVAAGVVRGPAEVDDRRRRILALSCLVYALALLLKMFLNTRILHYGFALAMPAGLVLVAAFLCAVPAWLDRCGRNGSAFRAVMLGAIAGFAVIQIQAIQIELGWRTVKVGTGADAFIADQSGRPFATLLERFRRLAAPGDTVVVLPEGVMFNYLLRLENPTPYISFMPPEMILFGEDRMLAAFVARPPVWIVLINRTASEYGYRFLGDDYGRSLVDWVQAHYVVVDRVLEAKHPYQPTPFAAILRHHQE
jgi:hypothetical protein